MGRVDRVSLDGKREKKEVAKAPGAPGPLRAFDGNLYWIAGEQVKSFSPEGKQVNELTISGGQGDPVDIAVGSGLIYLGMPNGSLLQIIGKKTTVAAQGAPISGLFLLADTLFVLRGTRFESLGLSGAKSTKLFCELNCHGLERTSAGQWLTVQAGRVLELEGGRAEPLLSTGKEIGRLAYVYRKEAKDDFFVLPFPQDGMIRAYRKYTIERKPKLP